MVKGLLILGGAVLALGWLVVSTIRRAEDPARMLFKWIFTFIVIAIMVFKVAPLVGKGGYAGAFGGIPLAAVCSLALGITWRRELALLVANPLTSLYDGGSVPPEPRPAYSVAQSRQKQGRYQEAVAEVCKQLERFPTDFEGHMLLAQIQAEDLKDLSAAELTIQRLCAQPGHAPANIAFALYSLADWYLKYGPDYQAAQRALEQVQTLLPGTEFALTAAQRIARLDGMKARQAADERKRFTVPQGVRHLGLAKSQPQLQPAEKDPGQLAVQYVQHLTEHPLDTEAREELAKLYADYYGRLDLAADQLEGMIQQPNQPARLVARWLNLLADLQIRYGADYDSVKATLERIIERGPNLAAAEKARNRLALLKLEFKGKQQNQTVKLGTYEQNLGLKQGWGPRATDRG